MRVGYIVSEHSKVSHTFIRREIAEVEACGVTVESMSIRHGGGWSKFGRRRHVELPCMRVASVKDGRLDLDEVKTIRIKRTEVDKLRIVPRDLLMTEGNNPDKLGRAALSSQVGLQLHLARRTYLLRTFTDRN